MNIVKENKPILQEKETISANGNGSGFDLGRVAIINKALKSRWFQPVLLFVSLFVFVVLIMAGLVGSPIGNRNASIIIVWIFWFFLLIALMIPLGGRFWCLMCPLPAPGEWLARLSIIRKSKKIFPNLGLKWPKKLDNIWIQNLGFLGVATFSPIILTRPWATAYFLIFMIVAALAFSLLFQKQGKTGRVFCKYICPLGGFIGLYSLMGALEIKVRSQDVCRQCTAKSCIKGSENGWGCPWYEYPGKMDRNLYCGLCTECIKTCPNDNVALKTRPFGADLLKKRKMDEAFKSFIMLGSAIFFLTVFFGWWGKWKDIADPIGGVFLSGSSFQWKDLAIYGGLLWAMCLGLIPLVTLGFAYLAKILAGDREVSVKKLFIDYAYALVPLGLMAWLGFVIGMIMVNGAYIVSVISDPFGWGWNLFGTAGYKWRPYFPEAVPYIQLAALLVGLAKSVSVGWQVSLENFKTRESALKPAWSLTGFFIFIAVAFISLFVMF
ncbi:MAG TPA: 4Fe-4S binding protein [bacterium]|nr:4Fe-4S binding protein [bacterium]